MAADPTSAKQDDIEELLRQAQMASGLANDSATPPTPPAGQAGPSVAASAGSSTAVLDRPAAFRSTGSVASSSTVGDDVQYLLAQAEQAIASVAQPAEPPLAGISPFELKDLTGAAASGEKATLELLKEVELDLSIELGRTQMHLQDVLNLKRGSVVALDKLAGDPVDVFVNERLVARGEVLVLNDNFCVRVTELLSGDEVE